MKEAGVDVSYDDLYAHLDFTFSHPEELLGYVKSMLVDVMLEEQTRRDIIGTKRVEEMWSPRLSIRQ
ncbi:hypothetical protein MLD38_030105 [Melastoma candidum]|nr:hypothetical protein MLD38_030105 [Melastoma candidum]